MKNTQRKDDPQTLCRIVELVRTKGASQQAICRDIGISASTLRRWLRDNPELAKSVMEAKRKLFESLVEQALMALNRRITGYKTTETKVTYAVDKDGNKVVKDHTEVIKEVSPDLSAIVFTLTNRDCDNWQQKPTSESPEQEPDNNDTDLSKLSETTLQELINLYNKTIKNDTETDKHPD